jgi:hypothetical protein
MPGKVPLPLRVPLATAPENRGYTTAKDAKLINCYLETVTPGDYQVIKRPGISPNIISTYPANNFGGILSFAGVTYVIAGGYFYVNTTLIGNVNTTGGRYWFSVIKGAIPKIVFSNTTNMYFYDSIDGLVGAGSVSAPPSVMVPGFAYLDATLYVLTPDAHIFGSGLNDVTNWAITNVIVAQIEPDDAIAIAKQLVYVIVFKQWSTEVFYDQGNAAGSPLGPNQAAKMNYGCVNGASVLDIDGDLFWVSSTRSATSQVMMMRNLSPLVISNSHIERLLQASNLQPTNLNNMYVWNYKGEGHNFYVLTLIDANLTLAYDIREQTWCQWTDPNGNYVPVLASTFSGSNEVIFHQNGNTYLMNAGIYMDVGVPFSVDLYTPNFDGGVDRRKVLTRIRFLGDQTPGCVLKVRCNDQDYNPLKWTNFRTVDMNKQRPFLDNCGTFYRRSYHINFTGNAPMRLRGLDVDMDLGSL